MVDSCPMILPWRPCPSLLHSSNHTHTLFLVSCRPPLRSRYRPLQSPACSPQMRARRLKLRSRHLEWGQKGTNLLKKISATDSRKCVRDISRMWRRSSSWNTRYMCLNSHAQDYSNLTTLQRLQEQDRRNHEAYIRSGEIFEDRQQAYEKMTKSYEKLLASSQTYVLFAHRFRGRP